jgi:hypothetical protein
MKQYIMSLQKSYRLDTSKIKISKNVNSPKIKYDNSEFKIQTPVMTLPYDLNVYDKGNYPKYSIDVSFRDMENNYKIKGFYDNMDYLDNKIYKYAKKHCDDFFEEKKNSKIIKTLQHSIIKWSKDKKTGLINEDFPPTMNLKLPFIRGKPAFTVTNFNEEPVDDMDLKSLFVKGKKVQAVIRCEDIWKFGGKFGCSWNIVKIRVEVTQSIANYSFVDDDDDSDSD